AAGQPGALVVLLTRGADADAREADTGNTALMLAANRARLEEVKLLLQAGADPNLKAKDGWTALAAAEMIGDSEIAALLRAAGAKE
ncbi:MAG: ankyrin repeat domain-containing protein, partial [Kiloniellaceae bacterium]